LSLQLQLDESGDVDRLHLGEIHDADLGTEGIELPDGFHVGATSVGIANVRAKEVAHPCSGFRARGEDGG